MFLEGILTALETFYCVPPDNSCGPQPENFSWGLPPLFPIKRDGQGRTQKHTEAHAMHSEARVCTRQGGSQCRVALVVDTSTSESVVSTSHSIHVHSPPASRQLSRLVPLPCPALPQSNRAGAGGKHSAALPRPAGDTYAARAAYSVAAIAACHSNRRRARGALGFARGVLGRVRARAAW